MDLWIPILLWPLSKINYGNSILPFPLASMAWFRPVENLMRQITARPFWPNEMGLVGRLKYFYEGAPLTQKHQWNNSWHVMSSYSASFIVRGQMYVHKYILVERCIDRSFSSNQLVHTTSIIVFQVRSIDNNAGIRLSWEFISFCSSSVHLHSPNGSKEIDQ